MSDFNDRDAEAVETHLVSASQLREGGHVLLEGHACVIMRSREASSADGGEVRTITALGLFNSQKYEVTLSLDQSVVVPVVTYTEYTLIDIADDGSVTLMAEDGQVRDDLRLPDDTSSLASFTVGVRENFEDGRPLAIGVESAMGSEQIVSMTQITAR
ncbi:hypothetical protein ACIPSA_30965 [Streptomyces sp. NPDC086549]|uniref:hypothetical protein n=1 Tax=Streptomyces sp. NPDC086549 TaxID=3365752 RepID=UPI00380E0344